jgi:hypothetical protein
MYIHRLTNHKMDAGRHIISITAVSRFSVNNFFKFDIDSYFWGEIEPGTFMTMYLYTYVYKYVYMYVNIFILDIFIYVYVHIYIYIYLFQ